ncbi:MAG: 30S ribosome-binding factor RbfA [Humidesulfovibrio sp.]|uniref:30S ribosome-binding factor RbfA n=1 Tax=Humidesulfovibrio sp. TaxID=2910988 RepID=UPI002732D218|nr:30S ribosome-binding factor RbfA [Humidesulfovibrio sp.]MDP2847336.1 30S ribosome-binding factor RbfA [Humidesulfovibrio sp.]
MKASGTRRSLRMGDQFLQELATLLLEEVQDPRLELVSLTGCKLNADMSIALVSFSVGGGPERRKLALEGLNKAKGFLRSGLARRMNSRALPDLRFTHDDFLEDMVYAKPGSADS